IGGLGWMKAPQPRGAWLTLYRTTASGKVGASINLAGSERLEAFERLLALRDVIDEEIAEAGLPVPTWERTDRGAAIALAWNSPLPWDQLREAEQRALLQQGANQLVNSFRPRIERIGADV